MAFTSCSLVLQRSKITENKEMASRLLQIPKQRELYIHLHPGNSQQNYSSARLKSDSTG